MSRLDSKRPDVPEKKSRFKQILSLRRLAELATVIGLFIAVYQLVISMKDKPEPSGAPSTPAAHTSSSAQTAAAPAPSPDLTPEPSANPDNAPQKVEEYSKIAVNKYVSRYKDKIDFGITDVETNGSGTIVHFYVDNRSDLEVTVPVFQSMFLVGKSSGQTEADPFKSDSFANVQAGVKQSGSIAFPGELLPDESYSMRAKFHIMDPKDRNTTFDIPFSIGKQ